MQVKEKEASLVKKDGSFPLFLGQGVRQLGKRPQFKGMPGPKAKIWKEEGEVPGLPAGREQSPPGMGWEALGVRGKSLVPL